MTLAGGQPGLHLGQLLAAQPGLQLPHGVVVFTLRALDGDVGREVGIVEIAGDEEERSVRVFGPGGDVRQAPAFGLPAELVEVFAQAGKELLAALDSLQVIVAAVAQSGADLG